MTATERRKMLLERLCVRRHETRENFVAEFGVRLRTIERDVVRLMAEYPIITTQDCGGGIGVEDWYKPDMKYLSDQQVESLEELLPTLMERGGRHAKVYISNRYSANEKSDCACRCCKKLV